MVERRAQTLFFPVAFPLSSYAYILGKTHLVKTSGGINPLGPMVAALIVAAICYGKAGVKELLGRYARWRIGWAPLTLALLFPTVITLLAAVRSTINLSQFVVCASMALRSPSHRMYVQSAVIGSNFNSNGLGIHERS